MSFYFKLCIVFLTGIDEGDFVSTFNVLLSCKIIFINQDTAVFVGAINHKRCLMLSMLDELKTARGSLCRVLI